MKNNTATFIGHKECFELSTQAIRAEIIKLIELGVTDYISGGMGAFDMMCAHEVYKLKEEYPQIHNFLVIPYLTFNIQNREYYDDVVYPKGFEKYHFKAAIPARNKYLVENSAYAICYIDHSWGGAAKTYEMAVKKGVTVINPARGKADSVVGAVFVYTFFQV